MATYYTSKHGDNSYSGTSLDTAKQTIVAGVGLLSAGDTLIIDDGVYVENLANVIPSGTSGNPTIIQSLNPQAATLRPAISGDNGIIQITGRSYITMDGLDLDGVNSTFNDTGLLWLTGTANNIIFKNGRLRNGVLANGCLIQDQTCSNITIQNALIDANGADATHHGCYVRGSSVLIQDSIFDNNGGYAIHQYTAGAWTVSGNVYRRNIVRNQTRRGVILSAGATDTLFYNNILHGNARGMELDTGTHRVLNCDIYNNTGIAVWVYGGTNHEIKNSVFYGNGTNDIQIDAGTVAADTTNNKGTDPKYVNVSTADFHRLSNSPDIHAGTDLSSVFTTDFDTQTRPGVWDRGAYQFQSLGVGSGNNRRLIASDSASGGVTVALSGNWQQLNTPDSTVYKTSTALFTGSPASASDVGAARWVVNAFADDQYASIEYRSSASTADGSSYIGVSVRASGDLNGSHDMYYVIVANISGTQYTQLSKVVNGTVSGLVTRSDVAWVAPDRIEIEVVGNVLTALKSGVILMSYTDSALVSGNAGIVAAGTSDSTGSNWEAGNLNDALTSIPAHKGRRFQFLRLRG